MKCYYILIAVCFVHGMVQSRGSDVFFLGMLPGQAPAIEKQLCNQIIDELGTIPGVKLRDRAQTDLLKRQLRFEEYPDVSENMLDILQLWSNDSTVLVWGSIERFTVEGNRRLLFRACAHGELLIRLQAYMVSNSHIIYGGPVLCFTDKDGYFSETPGATLP
jgi:hypothetical protein